jgi:hypothetical protein
MPQTTRWRFDEFTVGHYTMRGRRVKWFALFENEKAGANLSDSAGEL